MNLYTSFSVIIVLSALFAYINFRFIKLPSSIGLMLLALLTSFALIGLGVISPDITNEIKILLNSIDFSELLMGSMLSFMLFAGAIHINMDLLKQEKLSVIIFSTFSVVISTFITGTAIYYLLGIFNIQSDFIYCLLFGSLISPTDPIAVLGILKDAKISKSLEMKIAGESLFNDGVAVVVFLTILQVAQTPDNIQFSDVAILFFREAFGGIVFGIIIGYIGFVLMRSIDNYKVEVLITLAVVMGGYSLASLLHISGPLAVVAAGIIIGNHGKEFAMSDTTIEYIDKFWELIDETLNAILFVLIGLELLIIHFLPTYIIIGLITIILVLLTRYISVFLPAQIIKLKEKITHRTIIIMTWGGLRGGISIALALSLKPEMQKDLWVSLTYFVVAFSILVQGLTVGKLAKKLK
ncbi:MAG: sodium:proton antiporter [Saprospiraceae bacterium]